MKMRVIVKIFITTLLVLFTATSITFNSVQAQEGAIRVPVNQVGTIKLTLDDLIEGKIITFVLERADTTIIFPANSCVLVKQKGKSTFCFATREEAYFIFLAGEYSFEGKKFKFK